MEICSVGQNLSAQLKYKRRIIPIYAHTKYVLEFTCIFSSDKVLAAAESHASNVLVDVLVGIVHISSAKAGVTSPYVEHKGSTVQCVHAYFIRLRHYFVISRKEYLTSLTTDYHDHVIMWMLWSKLVFPNNSCVINSWFNSDFFFLKMRFNSMNSLRDSGRILRIFFTETEIVRFVRIFNFIAFFSGMWF